jgi:hypothetical protein
MKILPSRIYVSADIFKCSLAIVGLLSSNSFFVYIGATETAVAKHEKAARATLWHTCTGPNLNHENNTLGNVHRT